MIEKINFQELHNIHVLSKCLHMQSAATALQIPKSTLQNHLEAVEKRLGARIFERSQKSGEMMLTTFGKTVIPKIQDILWLAGSLSAMDGFSKEKHNSGEVSIMSTQTILENYICPNVREFLLENQEIKLSLRQKDENYYSQPNVNEIFIGCWEDNTENYEYFFFHTYVQTLWASEEYLKSNPPINEINDLQGHTIICLRSINEHEHIATQDSFFKQLSHIKNTIKILNVAGPRTTDVLAEHGAGLVLCAPESVRLCGLKLKPVLPQIAGEIVNIYVKVHKQFLKWPLAKFITDWIFSCRDGSLKSIGITPKEHKPLLAP